MATEPAQLGDAGVEPRIHSHIEDCLPDEHPLAFEQVMCGNGCGTLVHAFNNECMSTWLETGKGNFCFNCFIALCKVEDEEYGLAALDDEWGLEGSPDGD